MLQASCVRWFGRGVLITGASGSGKSALAAELLGAGARLVTDDATAVRRNGDRLTAAALPAPSPGPGLIELRGTGIFRCANGPATPLDIVVLLVSPDDAERLPEPSTVEILGLTLPACAAVADGRPRASHLLLALSAAHVG